jgi:Uncharacterised protein family, YAP/Alf4/glomulin
MGAQEDPFYALRPPNSDVPTYLTFIEDNLTKSKLSTLQEVLQDAELIETIGWDLVKILVPLLPESEACLLDVARRGNPREVVLKVAEAVRDVELAPDEDDEEEEDDGEDDESPKEDEDLPLPVCQFQVLLSMLTILHPRIKAKYPSRFLSTTLQAVVAAHQNVNIYHDKLTDAVVKFVKTMTGNKRPHFPPRRSTSAMLVARTVDPTPDTEVQADTPETEEDKIHARLLQSFVTHILEDYLQSLRSHEDAPGLAWSSRYLEKMHHRFLNPNKNSTEQFTKSEKLESRLTTVGQLVALAQDLEIHSDDVLATAMDPIPEIEGDIQNEDEHPKSAESVPFSKTGSLYLFTARKAMEALYDGPAITTAIDIFPQHATLIKNFIGSPSDTGMLGNEPDALIDALLFLGLVALENNAIGSPDNDDDFVEYLQSLSLLSSISASPTLRYHAHYLTTTILRSHPSDTLRFMFIRDTLQHAPFENLKASAVGWIKGETLEANQPSAKPIHGELDKVIEDDPDDPKPLFATDIPLASLAPLLFPNLASTYSASSAPTTDDELAAAAASYADLRANYGFHLAALNLLYLLLRARHLHEPLQIRKMTVDADVLAQFVQPLRQTSTYFGPLVAPGGALSGEFGGVGDSSAENELEIMRMVTARVEAEIVRNWGRE